MKIVLDLSSSPVLDRRNTDCKLLAEPRTAFHLRKHLKETKRARFDPENSIVRKATRVAKPTGGN
jgi:hypothetical protein